MKKFIKYILRTISFFLLIGISTAVFFLSYSPVAFQKSISVTSVSQSEFVEIVNDETLINHQLDIPGIIEKIPYNKSDMVYEVLPEQLYNKTVVDGNGNCSNLSFGLAYHLLNAKHKCQIIHFLPIKGFLMGDGHTVINTSYRYQNKRYNAILDVIEGGMPMLNKAPLAVTDIMTGKNAVDIHFMPLNERKDSLSDYYDEEFQTTSVIGVIPQNEIEEYFNFMSARYVPFYTKNKKIEKILFNGLSVVFGYFPDIYVTESDYSTLFENNFTTKVLAYILIFSLRIIMILGLILSLLYLLKIVRKLIPIN